MNLIPLAVNVSRAWEIAKNGNFKIKFIGGTKYDGSNFPVEDIDLFKKFYEVDETDSPDMYVELCHDSQAIINCLEPSRFETLENINDRIFEYGLSALVVDRTLSSACKSLLKVAIERLELSATRVFKIVDISVVIAKMSGSTTIKPEHIAEAIQYHSLPKEAIQ